MKCFKCQFENIEGSTFCVKCGTNLKEIQNSNVPSNVANSEENRNEMNMNFNENVNIQNEKVVNSEQFDMHEIRNNQEQVVTNQSSNASSEPLNYLMFLIAVLMKPFKCFKEEEAKLSNPKTSILLSAIISVIMTLVIIVKKVISTVVTKTMDPSTFKLKTTVDFGQLKDLEWMNLIFKNLLISAAIVVAIALVYYIISLMFKRFTDFIKILSISATSLIPYIVLGMIVSPLLGMIWAPLSMIAMITGTIYSLLIFISLMNEEIPFEDVNTKIYFHLICLSILGSAGYYCYLKFMTSAVPNSLKNVLNLIK